MNRRGITNSYGGEHARKRKYVLPVSATDQKLIIWTVWAKAWNFHEFSLKVLGKKDGMRYTFSDANGLRLCDVPIHW